MSSQSDKVQSILLNADMIMRSRTDQIMRLQLLSRSIPSLPNRIHWRIIKERQISEQNREYGGRVC